MSGISVREVLEQTYNKLAERNPHQEIELEGGAHAEIANDSDWHRTRRGMFVYKKVNLFEFKKSWIVSRAEETRGYPADAYDSDLIALEFSTDGKTPEQIQKELRDKIEESYYLENTLIFGMANGMLGVRKTSLFGEEMYKFLEQEVGDYITKNIEIDPTVVHMDLRPVVKSGMKYKPELTDRLTELIENLLKKNKKNKTKKLLNPLFISY